MTARQDPSGEVDILLSVYNGEKYLMDQLNSLLVQSYSNIRLIIRDDGSTDRSPDILKSLRMKYPNLITILPDNAHLGTNRSYSLLLRYSSARYSMLCDQDDVWYPDKIARTLETMRAAELEYGSKKPVLVHTDLSVVDEQLQVLDKSFFHFQHINPQKDTLNRLLVQNVITGCTVMINQPLRELALPLPDGIILPDWWLGLTAAAFGRISCLEESTMHYRQHSANQVGPVRWSPAYIARMAGDEFANLPASLSRTYRQAGSFYTRFGLQLSPQNQSMVKAYSQFDQFHKASRLAAIFQYRLFKQGLTRNMGYLSTVASQPAQVV
ncbi:MAG: glycosyltransferase family 2 protein [Anaerolineales bacterium]|nr:glycosyltransferase family 2 protein [Anaerolineales bacterium]